MKKKFILFIIILIFLLTLGSAIFGAPIISETFNDCPNGDLSNCGWTCGSANFLVQTDGCLEGKCVFYTTNSDKDCYKDGSSVGNGTQCVYIKSSATNEALNFDLREGGTHKCAIRLSETGYIQYYTTASYVNITPYASNNYYWLCVTFETTGDTCNFGYATSGFEGSISWTGTKATGGFTVLNRVDFGQQTTVGVDNWWDYLGDTAYTAGGEEEPATTLNYSLILAITMGLIFVVVLFDFLRRHFIMK